MEEIKLLDVIALLEDLPEENLRRGEVGTVVEMLAPDVYEVEFSDEEGRTYALLPLQRDQIMLLHFNREAA
jgi:ribosomal 30S subunit maturation factor RimM